MSLGKMFGPHMPFHNQVIGQFVSSPSFYMDPFCTIPRRVRDRLIDDLVCRDVGFANDQRQPCAGRAKLIKCHKRSETTGCVVGCPTRFPSGNAPYNSQLYLSRPKVHREPPFSRLAKQNVNLQYIAFHQPILSQSPFWYH